MTSISRLLHRRGFGIHSPWVYTLLRDVLFESLPYYTFSPLRQQFPGRTRRQIVMDEQLFRLAHYASPIPLTIIGNVSPSATEYMRQGAATSRHQATTSIERIVVVEDIAANLATWQHYLSDPAATATFDIDGRRGIAIYNPQLSKLHYKV
ncbi:MAG: hypothetical protein IJ557_00490 [Bacteroidaceae bacterium]|nr:hypothetical protein [Bacteroidaceae bacterium]